MSNKRKAMHPATENQIRVDKAESRKLRAEALVWLIKNFPEAFDAEERIRPLKVSIMADILAYAEENPAIDRQEREISRSKLREAVAMFSHRMDYLTCLKAREERVDLFGVVTGVVSEKEAEDANLRIKKRIEKVIRSSRKQNLYPNPTSGSSAHRSSAGGSSYRNTRQPSNNNQQRSTHNVNANRGNDHGNPYQYNQQAPSGNSHAPNHNGNYNHNAPTNDRYNSYRNSNQTHHAARTSSEDDSSVMTHHQTPRPNANVTVRRKVSKTYDPQAVARLKEKLRTSRSTYDEEVTD